MSSSCSTLNTGGFSILGPWGLSFLSCFGSEDLGIPKAAAIFLKQA
jgi:hypothetical protein